MHDYFDKHTFLCEMYDESADKMVELILNFFPYDNSVQLIDVQKGKNLVRRTQLPILKLHMLQIGNLISIFSRLIHVKDCAPITKRTLFPNEQSTFVLIKPMPPRDHGKIITFIMKNGFRITRMKNGKIDKDFALDLYKNAPIYNMLTIVVQYVISDEVIGLELVGPGAVQKWRDCLGATDPAQAAAGTLRKLYGQNKLLNIAHGCHSVDDANRMLNAFFGVKNGIQNVPFRATMKNCTCCIIKPHVIYDGNLGAILEFISTSEKFYISAMAMFSVNLPNALEFYELYMGVLPEYKEMAVNLTEGKCVVLEVKCTDSKMDVVSEFRSLCGPRNPEVCRQLYPNTIRAQYGKTVLHNAVHCTDLPEDGETEVEYFFRLLANDK